MANRYRGETRLHVDGEIFTLRLPLAALASLEARFETDTLDALISRLVKGPHSLESMRAVLAEALVHGSNISVRAAYTAIDSLPDAKAFAQAYTTLLAANLGSGGER